MSNESKIAWLFSRSLGRTAVQIVGIALFYVAFTWAMLRDSILA